MLGIALSSFAGIKQCKKQLGKVAQGTHVFQPGEKYTSSAINHETQSFCTTVNTFFQEEETEDVAKSLFVKRVLPPLSIYLYYYINPPFAPPRSVK